MVAYKSLQQKRVIIRFAPERLLLYPQTGEQLGARHCKCDDVLFGDIFPKVEKTSKDRTKLFPSLHSVSVSLCLLGFWCCLISLLGSTRPSALDRHEIHEDLLATSLVFIQGILIHFLLARIWLGFWCCSIILLSRSVFYSTPPPLSRSNHTSPPSPHS
ncbi:hypothetical protein B0O80DRAFT_133944 [Mortierella sp. GBAus27b]|nr:hypothetical protein B0O80DRAFT_133944 [Mortierella sp. GBAus27b]